MKQIYETIRQMRLRALEMAYNSGKNGAHLGGGLSTIEIFAVLYNGVLNVNVNNPYDEKRDRLVVSKGHCVVASELTSIKNSPTLLRLGIDDRFCDVGDYSFLLEQYRLTAEMIAVDIKKILC